LDGRHRIRFCDTLSKTISAEWAKTKVRDDGVKISYTEQEDPQRWLNPDKNALENYFDDIFSFCNSHWDNYSYVFTHYCHMGTPEAKVVSAHPTTPCMYFVDLNWEGACSVAARQQDGSYKV